MINLEHEAAYWAANNPTLLQSQLGYEVDTGVRKIGDGITEWNSLGFYDDQQKYSPATGTDTYLLTYKLAGIVGYYNGMKIRFRVANANTGASTMNVNDLGAIDLRKNVSVALASGDLLAGGVYEAVYYGGVFQVTGGTGVIGSGTVTGTGAATRLAIWSSATNISSDANLTWAGTTLTTVGSISIAGLAGLGYLDLGTQSSNPASVNGRIYYSTDITNGFVLYSTDATNTGYHTIFSNASQTIGIYLSNAGGTPAQIGTNTNCALGFYTNNGNPKIRIATSGNVGINMVTDAATALEVTGVATLPTVLGGSAVGSVLNLKATTANGTSTVQSITFSVGNNGATLGGAIYNNGTWQFSTGTSKLFIRGATNAIAFNRNPDTGVLTNASAYGYQFSRVESVTNTADTLGLTVYNTAGTSVRSAWFVDGRGYIGMGTNTPGVPLHIMANVSEQMRISYDASNTFRLYVASNSSTTFQCTTASVTFDFGNAINLTNTGVDLKLQFTRTAGSTYSFQLDTSRFYFYNSTSGVSIWGCSNSTALNITASAYIGSISTAPTAILHLAAGSTSVSPMRLTSGPIATAGNILAGNIDFLTDDLYFTITTGTAQKQFVFTDGIVLTSGKVPVASTNGRLIDSSVTNAQLSRPLFDHYADANNSGTGETDLYSDTIAAGTLGNNGEKIIAHYGGIFTGAASSTQQLKVYFGGTAIYDSGALAIGAITSNWTINVVVIRESSSVVRCDVYVSSDYATLFPYSTYTRITGLTLANTQIIKITGTAGGAAGGSNQITAKEGFVRFNGAA